MSKQRRRDRSPSSTRAASGGSTKSAPAPRASRTPIVIAAVAVVLVVGGLVAVMAGGILGGAKATPAPVAYSGAPALTVSPAEASARVADGAVLLDVREDAEWAAGHVPGATHIPLGQLASRVSELPQGTPIMVICRSGNRSAEGRDILLAAGLTQVSSVDGGSKAWRAAGLPFDGEII
ncbi:MAG: rhodanese-like domain-containing protein [Chloroflexota bacterium]